MSQYTPGPWKFSDIADLTHYAVSQKDGAPYTHWASDVCSVPYIPSCQPKDVALANARLIASAPQLLEALKALQRRLRCGDPEHAKLRSPVCGDCQALAFVENAIRAAEGEE